MKFPNLWNVARALLEQRNHSDIQPRVANHNSYGTLI